MKKKNNQILEIHNYMSINGSPKKVINEIIKNISILKGIGFAGCLKKDLLKKILEGFMLDKNRDNQKYSYDSKDGDVVKNICEETIKMCYEFIDKKIHIFLFPTFDKFVTEKMNGVNGFSSWNNTILIFINFNGNWREPLKETIVHELAHAISPFYRGGNFSIGYGLFLDGIAEHFKDFIIQGKRSSFTQAVSEKIAWRIFDELKEKELLNIKDFNFYNELFYGTGKYPLWTGYTIGYYFIADYLKKQKGIGWKEILRINPEEIFKKY